MDKPLVLKNRNDHDCQRRTILSCPRHSSVYLMAMDKNALSVSLVNGLDAVPAAAWDGLGTGDNPFISHRFLSALEKSGSVGDHAGWRIMHLLAHQGGGLVGAIPLYLKSHSQGEYIFDHGWAEAFMQAGGDYYPKLQAAVPFTPAGGARILAASPEVRRVLLATLRDMTGGNGLSSAHITFCTAQERAEAEAQGWLGRTTHQFHWENRGWHDYDDFLGAMSSRKRKALRKERQAAQAFGGRIEALSGDDIQPHHWDAIWAFYQDTGARKWGQPYLTRSFFDLLHETMRKDCLLFFAMRDDRAVAGALNFLGRDTIYGRYWGCSEEIPSMHFELCYHQAIDWALAHGFNRVEAGAQGDHKLSRGYLPVATHSLHWIADQGFREAIRKHLAHENKAEQMLIEAGEEWGPFRKDA